MFDDIPPWEEHHHCQGDGCPCRPFRSPFGERVHVLSAALASCGEERWATGYAWAMAPYYALTYVPGFKKRARLYANPRDGAYSHKR